MSLSLAITGGSAKSKAMELSDVVFGQAFNESLIHQVVTSYLTNARAGTKAQKTRAEVRGGGIKPWKQKGTGRARAGSIRSPIWRGGGIVFAAQPKVYHQKVNKKMYRVAMCSILSELVRQNRVVVVPSITVDAPKTKMLVSRLREVFQTVPSPAPTSLVPPSPTRGEGKRKRADLREKGKGEKLLIVTDAFDENLYLSARNIPNIEVGEVVDINPVSLIRAEKLLVTVEAIKQIEELLA